MRSFTHANSLTYYQLTAFAHCKELLLSHDLTGIVVGLAVLEALVTGGVMIRD